MSMHLPAVSRPAFFKPQKTLPPRELASLVAPKQVHRDFDLKPQAVVQAISELQDTQLHVQAIGKDRWELCDPDLVAEQFWGPVVIAQVVHKSDRTQLQLTLHPWMLPQTVRRQWIWNLSTTAALSLAVSLTAIELLPWLTFGAVFGVFAAMCLVAGWKRRTRQVTSLGDVASQALAPIAHRRRRRPASGTPYRCLNSELKAEAKRIKRAGRRRFRFVLPWSD